MVEKSGRKFSNCLNLLNCSRLVFLDFWLWAKDLHILDCKFGFYVKNCIYSRLETPGNGKLGSQGFNKKTNSKFS